MVSDPGYVGFSMRADWIEIKRGDVPPQHAGIYASMNRKGQIVMNRWAYEAMGSPAAFHLLYDKANNRIGLKPTSPTMKNAYPALVSNRCGAKMVRAHRLLREHRITLPHTIQFTEAEIDDDGILILDLRTAQHSNRAKSRRTNSDAPADNEK